ncbi:MAG: DUF523 domain-containing protein, partial [Pseudomonadales bacterium]|nr:DUF523 domain-containing protein [Pseudomonadales bacterium]
MDSEKIAVGISSCLSGEAVRFNGQHKKSHFCWDVLSEYFRFTAVCPEMQAGLGVPRKPVRLVNDSQRIRVLQVDDHQIDVTEPLRTASEALAADLSGVYGFIFMQKSPSCGLHTVKTYNPKGAVMENRAMGVFAQAMQQRYPLMPMEESGRLNDDVLRENFLLRVWAYRNLIDMVENNLSLNSL